MTEPAASPAPSPSGDSAQAPPQLRRAQQLMREDGLPDAAIAAFSAAWTTLAAGDTGMLREQDIEPVDELPTAASAVSEADALQAFRQTAVVKLNGGLGTSMGMDRAKSLLPVRGTDSFLDLIARQILALRRRHGVPLPLVFMDSFRTRADTLAALAKHPDLATAGIPADFLQNREPKLLVDDLSPVDWPADPDLAWCPPGHGDLYPALQASGLLQQLLDAGMRYLFVSNSDNLGALPDPAIAGWFAASGHPFMAEFCRRTPADRKGGHLARRRSDGAFVLRESAQTAPEDAAAFGDIDRHRYFNTNNLWLDLRAIADLTAGGAVLELPVIRNVKTVDPTDPSSPKVVQIETAMGSAIGVIPHSGALEVPRSRFLPVKTTSDLLVVRSDAYELDDDAALHLAGSRTTAPLVELDGPYKMLAEFDRHFPDGPPSLIGCDRLVVHGDWTFGAGVVAVGVAEIAAEPVPGTIPDGSTVGDR
jgi:UTP--glucose-1-phosphate uridylyltransferase